MTRDKDLNFTESIDIHEKSNGMIAHIENDKDNESMPVSSGVAAHPVNNMYEQWCKRLKNQYYIRFAHFEEFPKLIDIWKICFHDTDRAAANIFMNLQKPENILLLIIDNKPVSMLSICKFKLTTPTNKCKGAYVYGVATLPEFQGKGYSTVLLEEAGKLLAHRGFSCAVLVPANEELFKFYKKRGYETAFNLNKASFNVDEICDGEKYSLTPISPERLISIRDACFSDSRMFVRWDKDYLAYITKESEFYGGGVLGFSEDGKQIYAVCYCEGDNVYIKELAATFVKIDDALRSIKAHFRNAKHFTLYLREDVNISYTNNLLPFGMIQWYDINIKSDMLSCGGGPAYLAHALD